MKKKNSAGIDILGEKSNIRDIFLKLLLLNIFEVFFALKVIQLFEGINKIMQNERDKNQSKQFSVKS